MVLQYCKHDYPVNSDCPECDREWIKSEINLILNGILDKLDCTDKFLATSGISKDYSLLDLKNDLLKMKEIIVFLFSSILLQAFI